MIAYVRGQVAEKEPARVVLEASGIGYEIFIPLSTYGELPREGEEAKLLVRHVVREDDEQLYGFATASEKAMFEKLLTVSGVGPKVALGILSGASLGELAVAIASGNSKRIAAIRGVGKKTAEKICVELKGKVDILEAKGLAAGEAKDAKALAFAADAIAALTALGFSDELASRKVAAVLAETPELTDTERIVRLALAK